MKATLYGIVTGVACTVVFSVFAISSVAVAADYRAVRIAPKQSVDIYWGLNLSGRVFVKAQDENGAPMCLDYWWIVYPFTNVKRLGRHCGAATFDLPGVSDWAIGGKLRAGAGDVSGVVYGAADEAIARQFPPIEFP